MRASSLPVLCALAVAATSLHSQSVDPRLLSGLRWRNLGPFRAGRVSAVSGAIGQPGVFYFGAANGGVWKTTSGGATWVPIFDSVTSVSSIGAVAVAPSDPNIVYVGTGDLDSFFDGPGDGMYESIDAGRSWRHTGLEHAGKIPGIIVDPRDPKVVLAAGLGDPVVAGGDRGVFRSTDGGASWTKTLAVNEEAGVPVLVSAPDSSQVVFAEVMMHFLTGPGTQPDTALLRTRIFKSTDAGMTWHEIVGNGLPRLTGILGIAAAAGAQRVYVIGDFGLYRSDDGGTTWRQMAADDKRIANAQGGYNSGVYVDPKNPDIVYTVHVTAYRSTDGGNTFAAFKGGPPGGDDPQVMWIDPTNGKRILFGYDQGAIVSFDGGDTWSSWYNQSTEQVYRIAADNSFPYWIYATQQDAGAIATRSRGNLGAVTTIDWKPVPGWEWGKILPDPRDPNVIYASGLGITKITYPTGEWIKVGPDLDFSRKPRPPGITPIAFNTWHGRQELLAGFERVLATTDGGITWTALSPDLTIPHPRAPLLTAGKEPVRDTTLPARGLWWLAPSPVAPGVIWTSAVDGVIQVTRDHGRSWTDVTIPGTYSASRPFRIMVEPSPQHPAEAYAAFDHQFLGDYAPHVYRTRDYGKTWNTIETGFPARVPNGAFVHLVRADPRRRGLLFAGTQSGVFVSFDDGDHWQSLQLNLPTTIVPDIAIKDNDLIVGTYGRGIWILDDYAVLRQLRGTIATELFTPSEAVRMRRNVDFNTPFPKEEPQAPNPPAGATLSYSLSAKPAGDIRIDVLDARGNVVRHLTSAAAAPVREAARAPMEQFWLAPPTSLTTNVGLNRAAWDLRYDPPPAFGHTFAFNGNPGTTPPLPEGPLVAPGAYTVRLTVDGKSYTQRITVRPDPRTRATPATFAAQHALLMRLYSGLQATWADFAPVSALRAAVRRTAPADTTSEFGKAAQAFAAKLDSIAGDSLVAGRQPWEGPPDTWSFADLNGEFGILLSAQDNGDQMPTRPTLAGVRQRCAELSKLVARWNQVLRVDLVRFNQLLASHGTPAISAQTGPKGLCAP